MHHFVCVAHSPTLTRYLSLWVIFVRLFDINTRYLHMIHVANWRDPNGWLTTHGTAAHTTGPFPAPYWAQFRPISLHLFIFTLLWLQIDFLIQSFFRRNFQTFISRNVFQWISFSRFNSFNEWTVGREKKLLHLTIVFGFFWIRFPLIK